MAQVLVCGGAGFIGSHIVDGLVEAGHKVRVYDNLDPQVHGPGEEPPPYLPSEAEFVLGDVRDRDKLFQALKGIEAVFYEAAAGGVAQSMYRILHFASVNTVGGATLLDILANEKHSVRKVVVASSMSLYGEGRYRCPQCGPIAPKPRPLEQLKRHEWEMRCPVHGCRAEPGPTDEDKPLQPASIYAITKRDHEEMFLRTGQAYQIPVVALRYFNVYGTRQALNNPHAGLVNIFANRVLNGTAPTVFEDGGQIRDMIFVKDVVRANLLAMELPEADYQAVNVGSGDRLTVKDFAGKVVEKLAPGKGMEVQVAQTFREGDIRHCFADTSLAERLLGFKAQVSLDEGLDTTLEWVLTQKPKDTHTAARAELQARGLTR